MFVIMANKRTNHEFYLIVFGQEMYGFESEEFDLEVKKKIMLAR